MLDLAGNVWEWTSDWYGTYPAGAVSNPVGPASGEHRTCRGGGWNFNLSTWVRAAVRDWVGPAVRSVSLGFRCARGAAP